MTTRNKTLLAGLFALFFLSGLAGLIYESIWTHYLKLFVGHAAYAQTLVLVIYMGGMALGSWFASTYTSRMKKLLPAYAVAEIVIGLSALVFHPIFVSYCSFSYDTAFPALNSPVMIQLYKWITASLLILPQTILLGATFPLMSGGIIRFTKVMPGRTISILYFVNSLGGAAGVLLSGFYLIEKLTFPGTVQCAGIIDLVVGAGVLLLAAFIKEQPAAKPDKTKKAPVPELRQSLDKTAWVMLGVAAATAASSFIYEVGWIRMLSLVLGSSTHSFELMLSAFILGIALGGFWIKNRIDLLANPVRTLAIIQVVMGACAVATLVFYSQLFHLMTFFMNALGKTEQGYIMFHVYSHLICLILMLPATICAGMTLPLVTGILYKRNSDESVIGKVYAANTMGAIVGALLAMHLLMPLFGLKFLLIAGGSIDMAIGLFLLLYFKEHSGRRILAVLTAVSTLAVALPALLVKLDPELLASGVFRTGKIRTGEKTLYYRDGKTSSVSLMESGGSYSLANNGKPDASIGIDPNVPSGDEHTQVLLAAYPLAYAKQCKTAGIIGLGSGMTASTLLESSAVEKLDVVEIEPCIPQAARLMGPKVQKVFVDKRSTIHIEDAKTFFAAHRKKYDIIISEPSNPWVSGVSSLFTVEFFSRIKNHLTSGGMLAQWFHLYEMSPELIASVLLSIDTSFADYKVFIVGSDMIILASDEPIKNAPSASVFTPPGLSALLRDNNVEYTYDFESNLIGSKAIISPLAEMFDIPLNSDFNPVLDHRAVKSRILEHTAFNFSQLITYIIPAAKTLSGDISQIPHAATGRVMKFQSRYSVNINADYEAWQAWKYVTALGTPDEASIDSLISRKVALKVALIRMAAADRSRASQQLWPKHVIDLLTITMPYLPPAQMSAIWEYIDNTGHTVKVPPMSTKMLALLRNISCNGDFTEVRKSARDLIGSGTIAETEYNAIFVAAFFLASIKTGTYDGVQGVWDKLGSLQYNFNLMLLYNFAYHHTGPVK